jgi:hypothetical protein
LISLNDVPLAEKENQDHPCSRRKNPPNTEKSGSRLKIKTMICVKPEKKSEQPAMPEMDEDMY